VNIRLHICLLFLSENVVRFSEQTPFLLSSKKAARA
jgi:hypothetical protein